MSDHTISCTIVNQTSATMVLASSDPNSKTNLSIASDANAIASGVTVTDAFTGSNSATSGCGGSVTYTMPNDTDILVIYYNTSTGNDNSYCFPVLQSNDAAEAIACGAYYCTASTSVSTTDDNGITTTITVYET
jgi:hypothetical protein